MKIYKKNYVSTVYIYEADIDTSDMSDEEIERIDDMTPEELWDEFELDSEEELVREKTYDDNCDYEFQEI